MSQEHKPVVASAGALARFVRALRLVGRLLSDPRVPLFPKLIPIAALVYVISPIDLIPDFILGLGQLDDIGIILLSIALFIEFCPRAVVAEHRRALGKETGATHRREEVIDGSYRVVHDDEHSAR
jgi:uncharacterized membrane protein YkvA (DUF1232 family)